MNLALDTQVPLTGAQSHRSGGPAGIFSQEKLVAVGKINNKGNRLSTYALVEHFQRSW